jgi:hypothetical protein
MPLPDFTSPTTFPPFSALPLTTTTTKDVTTPQDDTPQDTPLDTPRDTPYYLLATITENMTLTKPTLILSDTTAAPFALIYASRPATGPDALDLRALGLKKGATVVLPDARRTPGKEEGKQGFVAVEREREGAVRVVPGDLERVRRVGGWLHSREGGKGGRGCDGCGEEEGGKGLMKCTGCGEVAYCCKVSTETFGVVRLSVCCECVDAYSGGVI